VRSNLRGQIAAFSASASPPPHLPTVISRTHTLFHLTRSPTAKLPSSSTRPPARSHTSSISPLTAITISQRPLQTQYDAFLHETRDGDLYACGFSFPCREAGSHRFDGILRDARRNPIADLLAGSLRLADRPSADVQSGASLSSHLPRFAQAAVSAGDGLERISVAEVHKRRDM